MKKFIGVVFLFAIALTINVSCDKVEGDPRVDNPDLAAEYDALGRELRKVLLEEYTGQGCGNCPAAPIEVANLQEKFGKRIVPMTVHAGFFANSQFFKYSTLGTETGEAYDTEFGNSADGNPNGLVSRLNNSGTSKVYFVGEWSSAIGNLITDVAPLTFNIEITFSDDSTFQTVVSGEYIFDVIGDYNIICSILEDSISAPQHFYKGIAGRDQDIVEDDYIHRHVLRGNVNGIWGTSFAGGNFGEEYSVNLGETHLSSSWNKDQMYLVVYVYDNTTKEIIHVGETHISH